GDAICRVRVRPFAESILVESSTGDCPHGSDRDGDPVDAADDRPGGQLEAAGQQPSDGSDSTVVGRDRGTTLLCAFDDRATRSGVVCANVAGPIALSAVCSFEPRVTGGIGDLSIRVRAGLSIRYPGRTLDSGLRSVCDSLRRQRGL